MNCNVWTFTGIAGPVAVPTTHGAEGSGACCGCKTIKLNLLQIWGIFLLNVLRNCEFFLEQGWVENRRTEIKFAVCAVSEVLFQEEVVNSDGMIMPVCGDEFSSLFVALLWGWWNYLTKYILVNRNIIEPNLYPTNLRELKFNRLSIPSMLLNLWYLYPSVRICCQKSLNQLPSKGWHKLWNSILASSNFLVKIGRIWVFKRQIPTNHCKEYDPTRPNIRIKSLVFFPSNHFRRRVTGRSTCGF